MLIDFDETPFFRPVIRAMKSRAVRHAMAQELIPYSKHHALLDNQQFDYVARLLNSALQVQFFSLLVSPAK